MQKSVLVVDDEPDVIDLVRYNLKKAGYEVLTANEGVGALRTTRQRRPDVVVLDLMLPGKDGHQVCREIRSDPEISHTPVIMLTAKVKPADRINGLENGCDDYVTKPFSPKELVLRVTALLRRTTPKGSDTSLRVGDFVLDRANLEFSLAGESIPLTSTEFKLMALLLEKRGRILSRDDLLRDVWGYRNTVDTRTVDTHMRRLRSKLGERAKEIETVRGEGYRFNPEVA